MNIAILYEDGEALVIDKPGGLPMDRPRAGGASLADRLDDLRLGFQRSPVPVHRLDADTSGCLLLARNPKALKRFAAAFEARQVTKRYLGILVGVPEKKEGTIELALHLLEHGVAVVAASAFGGKDGFRISFAADEKVLEEAMRRIAAALKE